MYAIMKLGYEAPVYDGLAQGIDLESLLKVQFRLISQLIKSNVALYRLKWNTKWS